MLQALILSASSSEPVVSSEVYDPAAFPVCISFALSFDHLRFRSFFCAYCLFLLGFCVCMCIPRLYVMALIAKFVHAASLSGWYFNMLLFESCTILLSLLYLQRSTIPVVCISFALSFFLLACFFVHAYLYVMTLFLSSVYLCTPPCVPNFFILCVTCRVVFVLFLFCTIFSIALS